MFVWKDENKQKEAENGPFKKEFKEMFMLILGLFFIF